MFDQEDIKKINELIKEADAIYGTDPESEADHVKRASYKLGIEEAFNDDHEEQLDTMDMQIWMNGQYADEDRKKGYQRYCEYFLDGGTPKFKDEKESKYGQDFREAKWKEFVANKEAAKAAEEAAREERRRKRAEKKKNNE